MGSGCKPEPAGIKYGVLRIAKISFAIYNVIRYNTGMGIM